MATYTVRISEWVKFLENEIKQEHPDKHLTYSEIIDLAAQKIIDFPYRAYALNDEDDTEVRKELNEMIVREYLMREIGYETPELWQIQLATRLRRIMPKYRELYKTTLFEINLNEPYYMRKSHNEQQTDKRNIERDGNRKTNNTNENTTTYGEKIVNSGESNTTNSNNETQYDSDFPQASFQQGDYTSTGMKSDSSGRSESENSDTEQHSGTDKVAGSQKDDEAWEDATKDDNLMQNEAIDEERGHVSNMDVLEAVEKWRELIVNINEMIVKDLADLFMMCYN